MIEAKSGSRSTQPSQTVILLQLIELVKLHMDGKWGLPEIRPETELVNDLGIESLDLVELLMVAEDRFDVHLSDELLGTLFPRTRPWTIAMLAHAICVAWGTGKGPRTFAPPAPLPPMEFEPFTQFVDAGPAADIFEGPLYEPAGTNREGFPVHRRRTDGMRCVLVPAGEAVLGSDDSALPEDCRPARRVPMSATLVDAEPVSNFAFCRFLNCVGPVPAPVFDQWCGDPMRPERRPFPLVQPFRLKNLVSDSRNWQPAGANGRHPMVLVSWFGANAYSLWANRRDWRLYRGDGSIPEPLRETVPRQGPPIPAPATFSFLPTEAQWEYAARGGDDRPYPWGHEPLTNERAVYERNIPGFRYRADDLPLVDVNARMGMSRFGLHHMAGNVWNWCADWYHEEFPRLPKSRWSDPANPTPSGIRCERGGSFVGPSHLLRSERRRGRAPLLRGRCLGFRCVGLPQDAAAPAST